jgi:hypothetical protein
MVSFEEGSFRDGAQAKQLIWQHCQPVIEEWVGRKVVPTSLYGIRVYKDKAILATRIAINHVLVAMTICSRIFHARC